MSETVAWGLLAVAASIGLVGVAYLIGRFIWHGLSRTIRIHVAA